MQHSNETRVSQNVIVDKRVTALQCLKRIMKLLRDIRVQSPERRQRGLVVVMYGGGQDETGPDLMKLVSRKRSSSSDQEWRLVGSSSCKIQGG